MWYHHWQTTDNYLFVVGQLQPPISEHKKLYDPNFLMKQKNRLRTEKEQVMAGKTELQCFK